MIVSKNWLAEYVQLPESVEDLTNRLTMSGLNLEEFHDVTESLSKPDVAIDIEVTSNRPTVSATSASRGKCRCCIASR